MTNENATEYAQYGDGWVKRDSPDGEWVEVAESEVPTEEIEKRNEIAGRQDLVAKGIHPDGGTNFAEVIRAEPPQP